MGQLVNGSVGCCGKNISRIFEDFHGHLTEDLNQNPQKLHTGFVRVLENLESPGKRRLVLESSVNLLDSSKKYEVYGMQQGELTLRSWDCRG